MESYELPHVPPYILNEIADILDNNKDWIKLMKIIAKDMNHLYSAKLFTTEDQKRIEDCAQQQKMLCAMVFFNEWRIAAQDMPTLKTLQDMLELAGLFKASNRLIQIINGSSTSNANHNGIQTNGNDDSYHNNTSINYSGNYIDLLEVGSIPYTNMNGASQVDGSASNSAESDNRSSSCKHSTNNQTTSEEPNKFQQNLSNVTQQPVVDVPLNSDGTLITYSYTDLEHMTNNFKDGLVGKGAFSNVYKVGKFAIKMLIFREDSPTLKSFENEVKLLCILRHKNVVPIYGYSLHERNPCIVCEFIEGGSLYTNLKHKKLNVEQRTKILEGVAEALKYVHSTVKPGYENSSIKQRFVHSDVKSTNILITTNFTPMLCDFGLAKLLPQTTHVTRTIGCTPGYEPPEARHGIISQKSDVFSYGTVLLEILTGRKLIVETSIGDMNIRDYVRSECGDGRIAHVLDPMVKQWPEAQRIYNLAEKCYKIDRIKRPTMEDVCRKLKDINVSVLDRLKRLCQNGYGKYVRPSKS